MNFIILLALGLAPGLVYLDATKHKIGKVPDEKGMANMSAGAWALCTLGLAIIAIPMYLIKRPQLISKAQLHPVYVKARGFKATALFSFFLFSIVINVVTLQYESYKERAESTASTSSYEGAPTLDAALPD